MGFLLSLFFGFVPVFIFAWIIYWMDRYEKEPKILLGAVFLWGADRGCGAGFSGEYFPGGRRFTCSPIQPQPPT